MITKEFKHWVEDIKKLIERRLTNCIGCEIWMAYGVPHNVISIFVGFNCVKFWISFDQIEYDRNTKKQRRSLAKCRRQKLIMDIEDFSKEATKIARRLK